MKRAYNPYDDRKSIHYVPNHVSDLGYSEEEAMQLSEKDNDEIERRTINYKESLIRKNKVKEIVKAERLEREMASHWYCTLSEQEIKKLINTTLHLAGTALNDIVENEKLAAKANYVIQLRNLIMSGMSFKVHPANVNKLKRFPKMEAGTGKIFGSKYSFLALWSHVYSTGRRSKSCLVNK